jgi:hypothetical protein
MGKRKRIPGSSSHIIPSAAALAALRGDDFPPSIKQALRLSQRGGRQRPRRCLACGAPALHLDIYVTYKVMSVGGATGGRGYMLYWTCSSCNRIGLTEELERKLLEMLT